MAQHRLRLKADDEPQQVGREHPDSGEPYKVTRDELGNDVTEHGKRGAGVSDRQDVNIHPETVNVDLRQG